MAELWLTCHYESHVLSAFKMFDIQRFIKTVFMYSVWKFISYFYVYFCGRIYGILQSELKLTLKTLKSPLENSKTHIYGSRGSDWVVVWCAIMVLLPCVILLVARCSRRSEGRPEYHQRLLWRPGPQSPHCSPQSHGRTRPTPPTSALPKTLMTTRLMC